MKVSGIGGVFIYANDPKSLAEWYTRHFEITFTLDEASGNYYLVFYYRDLADPSKRLDTTFAILPAQKPLGPVRGGVMINYRVSDLDALVAQLRAAGMPTEEIKTQRDEEGWGKFTHLVDPEGNRIELYQPLR